jgi:hypothetical protein
MFASKMKNSIVNQSIGCYLKFKYMANELSAKTQNLLA